MTERRTADLGPPDGQDRRKPGRPLKVKGERSSDRYRIRSIRLPVALDNQVKAIAAANGMTKHGLLFQAVQRFVDIATRLHISSRSKNDTAPNLP